MSGKGTANQPHDSGDSPKQAAGPGVEPLSGKPENNVGNSLTKTNAQEDTSKSNQTPSIIDQLSRTKTKEEIASQKRAKAQSISKPRPDESERPVEKSVEKPADNLTEKPVEKPVEAPRGRDPSQSTTTSTAKPASTKPKHPDDDRPSMALAPKSTRVQERSLSPGTLPDGSHVKCSGEKGESYTPPTGIGGKIGGKLRGLGH